MLQVLLYRRYWVTWKADGARYMLVANLRGCYLIDRSANVLRLQVRDVKCGHGVGRVAVMWPRGPSGVLSRPGGALPS